MGVTEPAMFGINLKYVYPFVAAMVGSAFGGMLITATNTRALGIGVGDCLASYHLKLKTIQWSSSQWR